MKIDWNRYYVANATSNPWWFRPDSPHTDGGWIELGERR